MKKHFYHLFIEISIYVSFLSLQKKCSLIIENLYIQYCSNTVNLLQQNQLFPSLNTYTVTRKRT